MNQLTQSARIWSHRLIHYLAGAYAEIWKGVSKGENKIWVINIHDIHTSVLIISQTCGVLVSCDIGSESPKLRPKVLILHADTWINARTIILNLTLSGSDTLMAPRVESVHVLKQWIIACSYTLIATYKCRLLRTSICSNWELRDVVARAIITTWNQLAKYIMNYYYHRRTLRSL